MYITKYNATEQPSLTVSVKHLALPINLELLKSVSHER